MFVSTKQPTLLSRPHTARSGGFLFMPKTASANTAESTLLLSDEQEWFSVAFAETDVYLSDEVSAFSLSTLVSAFDVSDQMRESRNHYAEDAIQIGDAHAQAVTALIEDAVEMSDAAVATSFQALEDAVVVTDVREASTVSSIETQDSITVSDRVRNASVQLVANSITLSDGQQQTTGQVLESAVMLSDAISDGTVSHGVVLTNELVDAFHVSDSTDALSVSQHYAFEHVAFSDTHFHKEPGAVAWVMNTETAAPSWYSNWQFSDMMQVGDRVFAVGPEGLVELGAQTDAGEEIDARLQYGFMDFGAEQKKRVDTFMFGYTADGLMSVSVETYGQPAYEYLMERREADSPRNNRIRPGKGLNARYWRIAVANTDGCDFDMDSVTADVAPSSRRL